MTQLAWNSYKKYSWGSSELKPVSKTGQSGLFGSRFDRIGATIVDSLDTLYIMGLTHEYNEAKDWVANKLDLNINSDLSVFEVNIRYVGGLLSMYSLTGENMFVLKAKEIVELMLPAFETPTGLPYRFFNPKAYRKFKKHRYNQFRKHQETLRKNQQCSSIAAIGTLSLEFQYLTDVTGNKIYQEKIENIYKMLEKVHKPEGLYYNLINIKTGEWCEKFASLGAGVDSFYEYLLKIWLYKNKTDTSMLRIYLDAIKPVREKLITKSSSGMWFVGDKEENSGLIQAMSHLACFSGGMFALTYLYVNSLNETERNEYKKLATEITATCHQSYIRAETHLGPEVFHFYGNNEAIGANKNENYYILRPEVVEAYFYMWRMTHYQIYRDWAWDVVLSLEKHCKTPNGYQGLINVYESTTTKDDTQQTFFLAETLKYLYLIFSEDDLIPLDKYVFNTEAHPILISNK